MIYPNITIDDIKKKFNLSFSEILQEIMIEKSLNQTALAEKIGVKQSQVSEWLKGKSKPGYDNLRSMCENLGVSAERLLGLDK